MIEFKKIMTERFNNLPKEEQEKELKLNKLKKENVFYETETQLIDTYSHTHYKKEIRYSNLKVSIFKRVKNDFTIDDKILISFGGSVWTYCFDKQFANSLLKTFKNNNSKYGLCVDAGNECYIGREETIRIIEEGLNILSEKNIEVPDDYYKRANELKNTIFQ